ncbi:discoidin domain-containing protein [Haloactinopolyspora sp.]|uniref:discoidin domain-containing protein n=1 Tax=Haloactinopolyspora sp. TaxID=1966353 RepID=UPI0026175322|nr:discoidin domain-containing protein [Haloactinopolyspora sp.]
MRRRRGIVAGVGTGAAVVAALMTYAPGGVASDAAPPQHGAAPAETVVVDGTSVGREFDGLGAVSAGASSRLLYDYPEPERSQILDYLFTPGYGASLQLLKVEIGGDMNSTSGAEPSHLRKPGELNCHRGYEWWLMREARKRNPDIVLGGLQWGAPGWFDGGFWSQDNIDYLLAWLDCAEQHDLDIDFMGGWNEAGYDTDWFVRWKEALQAEHPDIELTAADDTPNWNWRVADDMQADGAFGAAVDVVNQHSPCGHRTLYVECSSTETAKNLDKPLWIGELSSMAHDAGAEPLARAANRMYIDADITAMMVWSPISAWYSNITLADTGLMVAEWPWSGYYDVGDSIWAYAHTTQFAQPGWHYLDSASKRLSSGATMVALATPDSDDWSAIIETLDAEGASTLTLDVVDLPSTPMQLWSTDFASDDPADRFRHVGTITPDGNTVTLDLEPGHVYSITTTDGQGKGDAEPAASGTDQLDLPYRESFEHVDDGGLARYFSDLAGAFEAAPCGGGRDGTCYRQMVDEAPISWGGVGEIPLSTMVGDPRWWGDYTVQTDVLLEEPGYVEVGGRISGQSWGTPASGYHLRIGTDGWELFSRDHATGMEQTLSAGDDAIDVETWHTVALRMHGSRIEVVVDGEQLGSVDDTTQRTGNVALGVSMWDHAQFDDLQVTRTGRPPNLVAKDMMTATASSEHGFHRGWTHGAEHVIDDRPETTWSSRFDPAEPLPQSVTLDLGRPQRIQALTYQPRLDGSTNGMITGYEVQLSRDGESFEPVVSGQWSADSSTKVAAWDAQVARYVRLVATDEGKACGTATATAGELGVVRAGGPTLTTTPPAPPRPQVPDDAPPEFDDIVPSDQVTATASSVHSDPHLACMAVDGRATTFWHSAPAATGPLPASVTLDLGDTYDVHGLGYLPRQDGNQNGNITEYRVEVSVDGEDFTTVADGDWADDKEQKYATWTATTARYVRLTAITGHFGVAAAAELLVGHAP